LVFIIASFTASKLNPEINKFVSQIS